MTEEEKRKLSLGKLRINHLEKLAHDFKMGGDALYDAYEKYFNEYIDELLGFSMELLEERQEYFHEIIQKIKHADTLLHLFYNSRDDLQTWEQRNKLKAYNFLSPRDNSNEQAKDTKGYFAWKKSQELEQEQSKCNKN